MKKSRFLSLLLTVSLVAGLVLPLSAQATGSKLVDEMQVAAKAAILVDADNHEVLFEQNAHDKNYPASMTKIMTCMLTLEAIDRGELSLTDVVTASSTFNHDLSNDGSTENIKPGEQLTVEQLLYCALLPSANEACNILAEKVAGSTDSFVDLMNARATELGCQDTHFANCHGLHRDDHYTTAYDLSLIVMAALENSTFRAIVRTPNYVVPATNLSPERTLHNTNGLISNWRYRGYLYRYAIGVKTGSTPEAGQCLASAAEKDGRTLVAVVMGAENVTQPDGSTDRQAFSESRRLLEWGFDTFSRQTILDPSSFSGEVPVTLSKDTNYVGVQPDGTLEATLPKDIDPSSFQQQTDLPDSVEAPVTKGQTLGSVTLTYDGENYGSLPLVAVADVQRSNLLYYIHRIKGFFGLLAVRIALATLLFFLAVLVLRRLLFGRSKRRYGRGGHGGGTSRYNGRRRRRR
ncbi:MAG: D-alanyl-D-alanine carboxypeptidase [Intestinimonas sp.]|jgi:D-alanyl-D-alanine carboxypeptidase (penicillin-binding protein 5/6)|nr:D-alanyl-D-alanine carboxypeptidase [Intestinimonas sp.]